MADAHGNGTSRPQLFGVSLQGGPGGLDFEFIGIGTDLSAVLETLNVQKGPHGAARR